MTDTLNTYLETDNLYKILNSVSLIYFIVALVMLWTAKLMMAKIVTSNLNEELTKRDNKAVGVATAGYLFAVMIVIRGVLVSDADSVMAVALGKDVLMTILWSIISIILLLLSGWINDRFLLHRFSNKKELIDDQNVGTAAVIAASFISTAMLIAAAANGVSHSSFALELLDTLVYFLAGQIAFVGTGLAYQKFTKYDIHEEIKRDNAAAGISFGLTLVAVAILLSGHLLRSDSLIGFIIWVPLSMVLLLISRCLVNKALLPHSSIDEEIAIDQNWGVALIEGGVAIGTALVINASFA